jgi:hypothetical protein
MRIWKMAPLTEAVHYSPGAQMPPVPDSLRGWPDVPGGATSPASLDDAETPNDVFAFLTINPNAEVGASVRDRGCNIDNASRRNR